MKGLGALRRLWVQVLIGVVAGITVGALWPDFGVALKPLGDAFIAAIKMIIGPVIFCTVVAGIARMNDLRSVGRVGLKALIYFEVVSTLALLIGVGVGLLVRPGAGFNIDAATLDPKAVADYVGKAHELSVTGFLSHIIPDTFIGAFTKDGTLLQVLFVAVLTGFGCARLGEFGRRCADGVEAASRVLFSVIHILVRFAPLGAFGAMAFTIGKYGIGSLVQLGALAGAFAVTALLFVLVVLGLVCRLAGFSVLRYLRYIREELLTVLGASSSEAALPQLMEKMERLGAAKPVVGLVIPAGYSFNLDGTNIYMTLATLFLAQATNTPLSAGQIALILLIAMLTSKGASGVTGAGFITLAATLAIVPGFPVAAIALLIGIDRFMSEIRSLTNLVGNGVAALVVARWEGQLDDATLQRELIAGPSFAERDEATEARPV